ncbi:hypothetical protein HD806DRAFT_546192 [Xylariaceae sp. AK1471]|nr:hypothetical protein HD806DRAFT_546192 [Xylariaceae sp. AK1471]
MEPTETASPSTGVNPVADPEVSTKLSAAIMPGDISSAAPLDETATVGISQADNNERSRLINAAGNTKGSCTLCMEPGCDSQCSACKSAFYCSDKCVQLDQPCHSMVCMDVSKFSPRPSADYGLGLFFPSDKSGVRYVWYSHKGVFRNPYKDGGGDITDYVELRRFYGMNTLAEKSGKWVDSQKQEESIYIESIQLNNRMRLPLGDDRTLLFLTTCDDKVNTPGNENPTLVSATFPYGAADKIPKGPCYVIPRPTMPEDEFGNGSIDIHDAADENLLGVMKNMPPGDIKTSDFRHIVDWFLYHDRARHWPMLREGSMWATTFLCLGDPNQSGRQDRDLGRPLQLSRSDPIVDGEICPLTKQLGIPMRFRRAPISPTTLGTPAVVMEGLNPQLFNPYAAVLMIDLDIDSPTWSHRMDPWNGFETGTVYAVREDRGFVGDLPSVLVQWFFNYLSPLFGKSRNKRSRAAREHAMKFVTLQNFEYFRQSIESDWVDVTEEEDDGIGQPTAAAAST